MITLGVDIGGTNIRIGAITPDGVIAHSESHRQKEVIVPEDAVSSLTVHLQDYISRNYAQEEVIGIGIGLPGTLSKDQSTVLSMPNVKGFDGINLRDTLGQAMGISVFPLKDVSALFYHDRQKLNLDDEDIVVGYYVGTGLGNVIYLNGQILTGQNGSAGELGHIPINDFDGLCGCGNAGCAEAFCGGLYLAKLQAEHFPETPMGELFAEHSNHPLIQEYVERLSLPIASEINILDPGTLLLGGGVINMPRFPFEQLEKAIRRHARKPFPEQALKVIQVRSEGEPGVIGAGLYAWDMIERKVSQ